MATPSARRSSGGSRVLLGKAVRRAERRLHGWQTNLLGAESASGDRQATQAQRLERQRVRRLEEFYESICKIVGRTTGSYDAKAAPRTPAVSHVSKVKKAVRTWGAQDIFFSSVVRDEPLDQALVDTSRRLIRLGSVDRVRSLANVLQGRPDLASVGEVLSALVAVEDALPAMAWEQLAAADRTQVLRIAPAELFRSGFLVEPAVAGEALQAALRDDAVNATAAEWFDIASTSFAAGFETESREALSRARSGAEADGDDHLVELVAWLEDWYGTAENARQEITAPAGTIPFAVLDYKQPDEAFASKNLGDHVQTIASLGHLVRRSGFRFSGETDALRVAETLQKRVKPERVIDGDDAEVTLYRVQRDATNHDLVPDGTWLLAFGWYMHRQFGVKFDMPFNPRLRPIFVSFHVNAPAFLTDGVIDYLKKYAPVGCRDWNTVHLLQSAGVPAFFSGCLTTTVDTVFPPAPEARPTGGTLYVDTPPTGPGVAWKQTAPEIRRRGFADNVDDALEVLNSYQVEYDKVVTSRLHCYLPARSLGAEVEFRAKNPSDVRFDGLIGIDDEAYEDIRTKMLALLEPVIGAIGAGRSEDDVYALWRELTAPAVAAAESLRSSLADLDEVSFDVAAATRTILERSVTLDRTEDAPSGETVAIELSVGRDQKRQLDVVLESVVASATRPIHAYLLCRGHDRSDFDRVAHTFPTVTFTWLPTDDVDYGQNLRKTSRSTVATIDQLLIPELLPDVPRLVHLDVPVVVVGDIAELADTDLAGFPLAARTSPQAETASGFLNAINSSKRMKDENPLARELILRTHTRHAYDFLAFNAAVMVLDLDRMRGDDFCRHFLPWVERFGLDAQEVLNTYVGGDRAHLDPRWNQLPSLEVVHDPQAVAWTGTQMPWDADYVQCQEIWDDYAGRVAGVSVAGS